MENNSPNQTPFQGSFPPTPPPATMTPVSPMAPTPIQNATPALPNQQKSQSHLAIIMAGVFALIAIIATILVVVIMNSNNEGSSNNEEYYSYSETTDEDYDYRTEQEKANSKKTLKKCDSALDCIQNLDNAMGITVEQYNAAIGSDGTVDPDAYNSEYETTYIWEFSNGDKLSATFSEYSKVSIEVKYNFSAHINTNVNLDGYDEVQDEVEHGITYDELKAALGGIDGLLTKRSGYYGDKGYLWVGSTAARYIKADVDENNIVTFVTGVK